MVLEHFDIDEGGLRFGRSCKIDGYFAGIILWTAFAFCIASNIILCSVVCNGAVCFTASGVCMVLAIVVYHHLNLSLGFRLPGSQGNMQLRYGWCLLSTLILGIITTLFGILLILADYKYPQKLTALFFLETALESHYEVYTYRYPVPVVENNKTGTWYAHPIQYNKNNKKRLTTTLNRYLNYGYECSENKKKSSLFGGSDSDLSTVHESDGAFSPGPRFPE